MDILVACAADDQGLAAARCHPRDPFGWVFASFGIEVLQGANVVHFHLFG
jgi:hypothetical protein